MAEPGVDDSVLKCVVTIYLLYSSKLSHFYFSIKCTDDDRKIEMDPSETSTLSSVHIHKLMRRCSYHIASWQKKILTGALIDEPLGVLAYQKMGYICSHWWYAGN